MEDLHNDLFAQTGGARDQRIKLFEQTTSNPQARKTRLVPFDNSSTTNDSIFYKYGGNKPVLVDKDGRFREIEHHEVDELYQRAKAIREKEKHQQDLRDSTPGKPFVDDKGKMIVESPYRVEGQEGEKIVSHPYVH